VSCPNFTGVDDKARNSVEQKRKEVRSEAELGGKVAARPRQGGGDTGQIRGRGVMGTATM